jgi:hypothetical protein
MASKKEVRNTKNDVSHFMTEIKKAAYTLLSEGHARVFDYTIEDFLLACETSLENKKIQYKMNVSAIAQAAALMFGDGKERAKFFGV